MQKAMQLDRQPTPPWWCSMLDGSTLVNHLLVLFLCSFSCVLWILIVLPHASKWSRPLFSIFDRPKKRLLKINREFPPGHSQLCNFSGGGNLRETIISPGSILLGLSADTLFGGVWCVQPALCESRCNKKTGSVWSLRHHRWSLRHHRNVPKTNKNETNCSS